MLVHDFVGGGIKTCDAPNYNQIRAQQPCLGGLKGFIKIPQNARATDFTE